MTDDLINASSAEERHLRPWLVVLMHRPVFCEQDTLPRWGWCSIDPIEHHSLTLHAPGIVDAPSPLCAPRLVSQFRVGGGVPGASGQLQRQPRAVWGVR